MLLNNLFTYKLEHKDEETLNAIVSFDENHDIYKGHFPNQPVTPGVCQIEVVKEILATELNVKLKIKEGKEVKYIVPHIPNVRDVRLQATVKKADMLYLVNATLLKDDMVFMKLRLSFEQV